MRKLTTITILCLASATLFLSFKVNRLQAELTKAQPRIAMANMVIEAANQTPTNMTGVLIYVSRQK